MSVRRGRPWVAYPVRERDGRMGGRVRRVPNRILAKWVRQQAARATPGLRIVIDCDTSAFDAALDRSLELLAEPFPTSDDDEYDDYEERECYWCGGEGYAECNDPLGCLERYHSHGECRCKSCGGSGLRKDMTVW